MSGNIETVNVQFLNQSFLDKIDSGMTKEAGVAMSAFVRQKLREDGFTRKILTPYMITASELDRQLSEEPVVIVEKEIESVAANMPFLGRPDIRYFTGARYPVTFSKITTDSFRKSKFELMTYRTDIRTVLQENSIKDLQEQEDKNFYGNTYEVAAANGNVHNIVGGFTKANLMAGIKSLVSKKLPVGCILMTQAMYMDLLTFPATEIGSPAASELFRGQSGLESAFGVKIITTNKNNILPENQAMVFTTPEYFGQMYLLQDATTFLKVESDIIQFETYESVGAGIGNVNGVQVLNF